MRDVVVVGSGAAGLSAAVSAASRGVRATLLERASAFGGTTTYSGGVAWIPANHVMLAEGMADSPEDALTYLRSLSAGDMNDELCQTYAGKAAGIISELAAAAEFDWILTAGPDYHAERPGGKMGGRSLEPAPVALGSKLAATVREAPGYEPTTYAEAISANAPDGSEIEHRRANGILTRGRGLVGVLLRAAGALNVRVLGGVRARQLLTRNGDVVGVRTESHGDFAGEVILATGGFERDQQLVRAFLRGPMLAPGGNPLAEGDGLRMAMAAGAELGCMSEAHWCPGIALPELVDGAPYFWMSFNDRARPGALVVDRFGDRFANESSNYCDFTRAMHRFDPATYDFRSVPAWMVFDAQFRKRFNVGPVAPSQPDAAWIHRAETVQQLAADIGLPAHRLQRTVDGFNELAARGKDEEFGRGDYPHDRASGDRHAPHPSLGRLDTAPFYAVELLPGCLGTRGGPRIDPRGRVQRADGSGVVRGLYAAGNVAASLFGYAYPGAGGTIGPALVFGWLAGQTAALG